MISMKKGRHYKQSGMGGKLRNIIHDKLNRMIIRLFGKHTDMLHYR